MKQRACNRNKGQNETKNLRQKQRAKNRDQKRNQPTKIREYIEAQSQRI